MDTPQSADEQLAPPYETPYSATTPSKVLAHELNTGIAERRRSVVRSQEEFAALWSEVYARHWPKPAMPVVDFQRSVVLVAAMGQRNSGGHLIEFTQLANAGGNLAVTVTETEPGRNCGVTGALTAPVVILSVPRVSGQIQFIDFKEVHECL